jgi:hypothetical protein
MQRPAQSEKGVSLPEGLSPLPKSEFCLAEGQATSGGTLPFTVAREVHGALCVETPEGGVYRFIFKDLSGFDAARASGSKCPGRGSVSRLISATPSGWFGPDFVTIFAPEVGVCSI